MAKKKKTGHNNTTQLAPGWNVREPIERADLAPEERVNLDPEACDRLIKQHGVRVKVYRSLYCPNVKSIDGGEHNIDCQMCNGSGFMDLKPLCMDVVIQNQALEKLHHVEGFVDGNTVAITFPIGIEIQYFTLIELLDHSDIFFQRVARSQGDVDRLKYKALRINVLIAQDGVEYFEGTDFKLNDNGDVVWKDGKGPLPGTIYSTHYEANIQFRATRAVHANRFDQVLNEGKIAQVKFNEQWICTKEFLVRRQGFNGEELLPNPIPNYSEETPEE